MNIHEALAIAVASLAPFESQQGIEFPHSHKDVTLKDFSRNTNMCNNSNSNLAGALVPFGLKLPNGPSGLFAPPGGPFGPPPPGLHASNTDLQRAQLYDYNARLRLHYAVAAAAAAAASNPHGALHPLHPGLHPGGPPHHPPTAGDPMAAYLYGKQLSDPRFRYIHEEPKPSHSYIGLIAMAILSSKDKKLVLSDIYQWILDHYPYFRTRGPGWRNSIRHNLSLNDCFVKSGRSANGKGHYWAIHHANEDDFMKGDFRRRRAQRKVRKAMGLAVPDEEDSPSPPPASLLAGTPLEWQSRVLLQRSPPTECPSQPDLSMSPAAPRPKSPDHPPPPKKRLFDVESLLAPDKKDGDEDDGSKSDSASSPSTKKESPVHTPLVSLPRPPTLMSTAMPGRLAPPHQALWPFAVTPPHWPGSDHRRGPSAFHALPGPWGALHPHGYPLLDGSTVQRKWQDAYERIMNREEEDDVKPTVSPNADVAVDDEEST